mmetsp:Transcript_21200/g.49113  ORF Transcript_21200/g.49113 Transcript_21200/m.49113 type:complete len:231 (+) Transcript_21200:521-1213(+)
MSAHGQLAGHVDDEVNNPSIHRIVGGKRRVWLHVHVAVDGNEGLGSAAKPSNRDAHSSVLAAAHLEIEIVEVADCDARLGIVWIEGVGNDAARRRQALELAREEFAGTPLDFVDRVQRCRHSLQQKNHRVHNRSTDDDDRGCGSDTVCCARLDDEEVEELVDPSIAGVWTLFGLIGRDGDDVGSRNERAVIVSQRWSIQEKRDATDSRVSVFNTGRPTACTRDRDTVAAK